MLSSGRGQRLDRLLDDLPGQLLDLVVLGDVHLRARLDHLDVLDVLRLVRELDLTVGKNDIEVRLEYERGRGSHGTLYYGDKFTVIKDRKKEIGKGLYQAMLKQLGIEKL